MLCLPGCTLVFLSLCLLVCEFGCLVVQHCIECVTLYKQATRLTDHQTNTENQVCRQTCVSARNMMVLQEPEHENAATHCASDILIDTLFIAIHYELSDITTKLNFVYKVLFLLV